MAKFKSAAEKEEEARRKAADKQRKAEEKALAAQEAARRRAEAQQEQARRKQQEELLEPLRRALAFGAMPLYAAGQNPGLFAGKSKKIAEQGLHDGLIELTAPPHPEQPGKRGRETLCARITEKGRRFVLEADSPKKILEELLLAIKEQSGRPPGATSNATSGLGREIAQLAESMYAQLSRIQQDFQARLERLQEALDRRAGAYSNDGENAGAPLQHALETIEALSRRLEAKPAPVHAPGNQQQAAGWDEDVVRLVREQKQRNPHQQFTLPQIYERLKSTRPGLTLGQFHDGLRLLQDQKRIRLWPYTQGVSNVPDNRNALYLDQELKFYVDLYEGA